MPIYAYKCGSCGHAKDVLQKISDAQLVTCPACGADAFSKQITEAGFQLKGSGWYVTDFRNNGSSSGAAKQAEGKPAEANSSDAKSGDSSSGDAKSSDAKSSDAKSGDAKSSDAKSAVPAAPAKPPAPSASAGGSGRACASD